MNLLIVEDEKPAALQLRKLIKSKRPNYNIVEVVDSVSSAEAFLQSQEMPDLIFMDIQLADGLSFEIFKRVKISAPVIFTTAFDQYTLRAFKVNSLDYLLKPIDATELEQAIVQFENYHHSDSSIDRDSIQKILDTFQKKDYKQRFLVKTGDQFSYVNITEVAYFYSEDGVLFLSTCAGKRHMLDSTVDKISSLVDPSSFYRINRKVIVNESSIEKINTYFNSRLKLQLKPNASFEVVVAREKVKGFKEWLDS